ncbi:MAG: prenyltransferase/squalene oxidase repeat-containing protein [Planctomycetota bacterium]
MSNFESSVDSSDAASPVVPEGIPSATPTPPTAPRPKSSDPSDAAKGRPTQETGQGNVPQVAPKPRAVSEKPSANDKPTSPPPVPPPPPVPGKSVANPTAPTASAPPPVANGVGSIKGIRWRGEIEDVQTRTSKTKAGSAKAGARSAPGIGQPERDQRRIHQADGNGSANPDGVSGKTGVAAATALPNTPTESFEEDHDEADLTRRAPPWLISLIFHLIVLVILGLISSPVGENLGNVMLVLGDSTGQSENELAEFAIEPVQNLDDAESDADEQAPIDFDTPLELSSLIVDAPMDPIDANVGLGPQITISQPMFGGRTGKTKEELLKKFGGTPETVRAVEMGLEWLRRAQTKDGSWSLRGPYSDGAFGENRIAGTAMALLAFLGDGHTHRAEGPYQKNVLKGLKFLAEEQQRNGFFSRDVRGSSQQSYAQAQATIAVCEAYAMTGDSWLRPIAQAALDHCVDAQGRSGGWRYIYKEPQGDLSVTGWYVMALQSGSSAPDLEIDDQVFYDLEGFMQSVQLDKGSAYGYMAGRGESGAMNATGLLIRQYRGWQRSHKSLQRGVTNLIDNYGFGYDQRDVYYWYYATQVMHHMGGSPWRAWNARMREELPAAQTKRGRERGSWNPSGDYWGERDGGRLYTTCMTLYCLEVYYRHLPIYDMWEE